MQKLTGVFFSIFVLMLEACQPSVRLSATLTAVDTPKMALETDDRAITMRPYPSASPQVLDTPALLHIFPLYKNSSWSYMQIDYVANDPNTIIKATTQREERVVDAHFQQPYYFAHVKRSVRLVSADPGWIDTGGLGLGNYDLWYVVTNGKVYLSSDAPDPANIHLDQLSEEYDFPLKVGLSWCPNKRVRASLTPVAETPVPCASAGMREVLEMKPYQTQAGSFDQCYRIADVYNSGGIIQWVCTGIGIVAQQYDHRGSQFGFSEELVKFTLGSFPSTNN
jgi:hypothetical protein